MDPQPSLSRVLFLIMKRERQIFGDQSNQSNAMAITDRGVYKNNIASCGRGSGYGIDHIPQK